MAVYPHGVAVLAMLVAGAASIRKTLHLDRDSDAVTTYVAGVPVHIHPVIEANTSRKVQKPSKGDILTDNAEHDWVVMLKAGASDALMKSLCKLGKQEDCELVGHADVGVPFLKFRGTGQTLGALLESG